MLLLISESNICLCLLSNKPYLGLVNISDNESKNINGYICLFNFYLYKLLFW